MGRFSPEEILGLAGRKPRREPVRAERDEPTPERPLRNTPAELLSLARGESSVESDKPGFIEEVSADLKRDIITPFFGAEVGFGAEGLDISGDVEGIERQAPTTPLSTFVAGLGVRLIGAPVKVAVKRFMENFTDEEGNLFTGTGGEGLDIDIEPGVTTPEAAGEVAAFGAEIIGPPLLAGGIRKVSKLAKAVTTIDQDIATFQALKKAAPGLEVGEAPSPILGKMIDEGLHEGGRLKLGEALVGPREGIAFRRDSVSFAIRRGEEPVGFISLRRVGDDLFIDNIRSLLPKGERFTIKELRALKEDVLKVPGFEGVKRIKSTDFGRVSGARGTKTLPGGEIQPGGTVDVAAGAGGKKPPEPPTLPGADFIDIPDPGEMAAAAGRGTSPDKLKRITSATNEVMRRLGVTRDPSRRLAVQMYEALKEIDSVELVNILRGHGLEMPDLLGLIEGSSAAARQMNSLAQISKAITSRITGGDKAMGQLSEIASLVAPELTTEFAIGSAKYRSVYRKFLVSGMDTAARNAISSYARVSWDAVSSGFEYLLERTATPLARAVLGGKKAALAPKTHAADIMAELVGITGRNTAARQVSRALTDALPGLERKLRWTYGTDMAQHLKKAAAAGMKLSKTEKAMIQADKFANAINIFNVQQEKLYRPAIFGSNMIRRWRSRGKTVEQALAELRKVGDDAFNIVRAGRDFPIIVESEAGAARFAEQVPKLTEGVRREYAKVFARLMEERGLMTADDLAEATGRMLDVSFTTDPKKQGFIIKSYLEFVEGMAEKFPKSFNVLLHTPGIRQFITFPRFIAASLKFGVQNNPLYMLKLFKAGEIAKIAAGETEVLARGMAGMTMYGFAYWIRKNAGGDRWHEVKVGDQTFSTLAYSPMAAPLFIADIAIRMQEGRLFSLDKEDIPRNLIGLRREYSQGNHIKLIDDAFKALTTGTRSQEDVLRRLKESAGSLTDSHLPGIFRSVNDFYEEFIGTEQVQRDLGLDPFSKTKEKLGPLTDLLGIDRGPARELPTRSGARTRPNPIARQLGVTTISKTNAAERALASHQLQALQNTGIPQWDALVSKHLGPMVENVLGDYVQYGTYSDLSPALQREELRVLLASLRRRARASAERENPELAFAAKLRGQTASQRTLTEQGIPQPRASQRKQGLGLPGLDILR